MAKIELSEISSDHPLVRRLRELLDTFGRAIPTDGETDASGALQELWGHCEGEGRGPMRVPLAQGQRYYLASPVVLSKSDLALIGDVGPMRQQGAQYGYITGPSGMTALFDYGGDSNANPFGHLHVEKLAFWSSTTNTTPAFKISQDDNMPHRGGMFRDCSFRGFETAILLEAPTPGNLGLANLNVENCNFSGGSYAVRALSQTFGLRFVNNQAEQGATIAGLFDSGVTITDNMLEGQSNAIDINSVARTKVYLARNYFELNGGSFVARFETLSQDSEICIDENYGFFHCTATDMIRLEGAGRVRLLPPRFDLPAGHGELLTFYGFRSTNCDLNGQGFLAKASALNQAILPYEQYAARAPTGWTITRNVGTDSFRTPFGDTTTGLSKAGWGVGNVTLTGLSYAAGDVMLFCALAQLLCNGDDYVEPLVRVYNAELDGPSSFPVLDQLNIGVERDGRWFLLAGTSPLGFSGDTLNVWFGPNGTNASEGYTLNIAAIGYKIVPAADIDAAGRVRVQPVCPW